MIDIDKCRLICYPSRILTRRAEPVQDFDDNLRQCVDKMRVIMEEKKGIGLAAPQVGVLLRFFLIGLDGEAENVKVFINPELTLGCLPRFAGPRPVKSLPRICRATPLQKRLTDSLPVVYSMSTIILRGLP